MKKADRKKLIIGIVVVIIVVAFLSVLLLSTSVYQAGKTPTTTPTSTTTNYVEVKYKTIGWFYAFSGFNHTYLVLNVSITNRGYTQVNPRDSNGFEVIIGKSIYKPLSSLTLRFLMLRNETSSWAWYDIDSSSSAFNLGWSFPSESIKLRDNGTIAGLIVFKFGEPNIVPQPPQIFRVPFTLRYSVTYGESFNPFAQAIVKVIEVKK